MANLSFPWLRPLWQQLLQAARSERMPHAIGFTYQLDMGAESLLQQLAAYLLCQGYPQVPRACGKCKSCLLLQAGTHPDFLRIEPEAGKQIGVDSIRAMAEKIQQTASQGGNKVVQIIAADNMTPAAANALLKTLEEPPANTYLQLAAVRYQQLLATVRSRLLYYHLAQPQAAEIADWLTTHSQGAELNDTIIARAQLAPLRVLEELNSGSAANTYLAQLCQGVLTVPKELPAAQALVQALIRELQQAYQQVMLGQTPSALSSSLRQLPPPATLAAALSEGYGNGIQLLQRLQQSGLNTQLLVAAWSAQLLRSLRA